MASNWKHLSHYTQIPSAQFTMLGHLVPSEPLDFSAAPVAPASPVSQAASPVLDLSVSAMKTSPPPPPPSSEGSASPPWGWDHQSPLSLPPASVNAMLKRKATGTNSRPFKAYPRFPSTLPMGLIGGHVEQIMNRESMQAFESFRSQMLSKMGKDRGRANRPAKGDEAGSPQHPSSSDTDLANMIGKEGKDAAYWERRRKNNEAAKRSRDNRRNKEDELAIWASFLEQENLILKSRLAQGHVCAKCQTLSSNSN